MKRLIQILSIVAGLVTLTAVRVAAQNLNTASPIDFFTNVASHLLSQELNLNLNQIQVYPTNQYTPAVHRLLQVTANIYDATTTNSYPTIFRPLFSCDANLGNIFITGYQQVMPVSGPSDPQLTLPLDASALPVGTNMSINVYGVPWVIGVKKGLPNFNEVSMQEMVQISRKLAIGRSSVTAPPIPIFTNQMYVFNISNSIGIECWNSYTNDYSDPVQIIARDTLSMALALTNGTVLFIGSLTIPSTQTITNWPGSGLASGFGQLNPNAFIIPIMTNITLLTNSVYRFETMSFVPVNQDTSWESTDPPLPRLPQLILSATNQLQLVMLDGSNVVDYVQLSGPNSTYNLNSKFETNNVGVGYANAFSTVLDNNNVPWGIASQIAASEGFDYASSNPYWNDPERYDEMRGFASFMGMTSFVSGLPSQYSNLSVSNYFATNLVVQAPYTPSVTILDYMTWQANDPLVHYLGSDLNVSISSWTDGLPNGITTWAGLGNDFPLLPNIGWVNDRYAPWGINSNPDSFDVAYKDPLVWIPDDWNFPVGQSLEASWLGRVHRGTPWQTIYLKASTIDLSSWENWTGDTNDGDARLTQPTNDWRMTSLLMSMFDTNNLLNLLSVNNVDSNAWLTLLNGLTAWTNSSSDDQTLLDYYYATGLPQFDTITISSNLPQAAVLADAIQSARAGQAGGFFRDVGDILALPQLTEESPFLNWNDSIQQQYGISDEAYEKIPSQLLPLLRADSIGSISSNNGQRLVQFTGYDGHAYVIEASSNLVNWTSFTTNYPMNGILTITNLATANAAEFYRSVLLN